MINKNNFIWNKQYQLFEKNKSVGIRYPTEALVIFVSTLRKNKLNYFSDQGKEYSTNNSFYNV